MLLYAWMMRRGEQAAEPRLRETQERLAACHYAMAHPEDGTLVPACVQHAVLDPAENAALRTLLPIVEVRSPTGHSSGTSPKTQASAWASGRPPPGRSWTRR
ncbi:hypothetical protein ABZ137_39095 [Streptomyces bobili]|uniref:hypothetical protein n=1 Tax=Streptomyces bobili TaxID=67280 RepID=UPI0033A50D07